MRPAALSPPHTPAHSRFSAARRERRVSDLPPCGLPAAQSAAARILLHWHSEDHRHWYTAVFSAARGARHSLRYGIRALRPAVPFPCWLCAVHAPQHVHRWKKRNTWCSFPRGESCHFVGSAPCCRLLFQIAAPARIQYITFYEKVQPSQRIHLQENCKYPVWIL